MARVDDEEDKVLQNVKASTENNDIWTSRNKIVEVEQAHFPITISHSPSPPKLINDIMWCGNLEDNLDEGLDAGSPTAINDSVFGLGVESESLPDLTSTDKFNEISPLKLPPDSDMKLFPEPIHESPAPVLTPNLPNCKRSINEQLENDGQDLPPKLTPHQSPPVSTPSASYGQLSPRTKRLFRLEEPSTGEEHLEKEQDFPSELTPNQLPLTSPPPVFTTSSSQLSPRTKRLFRLGEPSTRDEQLQKEQDPSSKSTPTQLPVGPPPLLTPSSNPRTPRTKRLFRLEPSTELSMNRSLRSSEVGGVEGPPYTFPPFPMPSPCSEDWRRTNVHKQKLLKKLNKMMDLTSENGAVFNSDPVYRKRTTGMFAKDYTSIFKPDVVPADAPVKEMKAKLEVHYSEETKRLKKKERISREIAEATANSINLPNSVGQSRTYSIKLPKQISEPAPPPPEYDNADDSSPPRTPPRSPKSNSSHPQDSDLIVEPGQGNIEKLNHSREPNLVAQFVPHVPRIVFFARRNIKAGEELTWDNFITTHQDHVQEQQPKENINPNPVPSAAALPPTTAALEDKKSDDLKDECFNSTMNTERC